MSDAKLRWLWGSFNLDVHPVIPSRLERGNLFEDLCSLVSKTAYPVAKGAISSLHKISLDAMLAILQVGYRISLFI